MKRSDLIRSIKVQFDSMRTEEATIFFDNVINNIKNAIKYGNKIEIRGFGTIQSRHRATKELYNPIQKKYMIAPANTTILFKPSKELTNKMNG
ncbi:MAG: HU family DNA-binding protein [Alphaproteobacteria bacterium]|nr:HU family DNA-binding protein [Alphaproteobacteria bacterium]